MSGSRDSTLASATSFPDYDFPVYLVDGRPSLAPVTVPGKPRVLVISMPKAGTYLLAAYLKKLGLVDTGIHINDDGFSDYRGKTISEVVSRYREFRTFCSLSTVTDLMHEGQFAVGHISCNSTTLGEVAGTRIIFSKRELRSALISQMRWLARPGRGEDWTWKGIKDPKFRLLEFLYCCGSQLISWYESISPWSFQPGVLTISFECIVGADPETVQRLAMQAGADMPPQRAVRLLRDVLEKPTKTWSGRISKLAEYWSREAEELFQRLGGAKLNQRLGYPAHLNNPKTLVGVRLPFEEVHQLLAELDGTMRLQRQEISKLRESSEQARKRELERELSAAGSEIARLKSEDSAFTWPNLCRMAARAIEACNEHGYRSVAFFGSGTHTQKLLPVWHGLGGPPVVALVTGSNSEVLGATDFNVPIIPVHQAMPPEIEAVVPSSHAWESDMRRLWQDHHPEIPWVPLWGSLLTTMDHQNSQESDD
ncbi:MAG TPA: hypothetical protein P5568_02700 [Acidobacteriota bacterium]|nr:hypothetical protein [Acidobacteriota bacterium]HRV07355.1 hypothetical protein [Acidobacteriota bacterium]